MKRVHTLIVILLLLAAACGGSDEEPTPTSTTGGGLSAPEDVAALAVVAEAARAQVELGGLRSDLGFSVADSFFNNGDSCAAVVFIVDIGGGERVTSTAYMMRTDGRAARELFPRADAMQPAYLDEWDAVVGGGRWGLLALAPPETDVEDVVTVCGDPFLDEALRRHFAVQLEPE